MHTLPSALYKSLLSSKTQSNMRARKNGYHLSEGERVEAPQKVTGDFSTARVELRLCEARTSVRGGGSL